MIKVEGSGDWDHFTKLCETWEDRYQWFLYEFAKQFTLRLQRRMISQISKIKGPKDYRRRLIVAEHRASSSSWFALVVKAQPVIGKDAQTSIIEVLPRFSFANDPIKNILQKFGPWTIDTIPFAPSPRQALVTIRNASPEAVSAVKRKNLGEMKNVKSEMKAMNMTYEDRASIMANLRVSDSVEKQILDLEFGPGGSKHWVPSIRWAKIKIVKKLATDKRLINSMIDPDDKKWMNRKRLRDKIRQAEIRALYRFQERIIKALPPS